MPSLFAANAHSGDIAAWTFKNGNPTDSLSGLQGTLAGEPSGATALRENALILDNAQATHKQAFVVADAPILTGHDQGGRGFTSIVLNADVMPHTLGEDATIIAKADGADGYQLIMRPDGKVFFQVSTPKGTLRMTSKNALKADGKWHHIEAAWDRDVWTYNAHIVLDGVVSWASIKDLGELTDTQTPLTVGGKIGENGTIIQAFDGKIKNVEISVNKPEVFKISGAPNPDMPAPTGSHLAEQPGWLSSQFIYTDDVTPECHAGTLAQNDEGDIVAAWFGGTREGHVDAGVWQSTLGKEGTWSRPREIAHARYENQTYSTSFNPVLFQAPGGGPLLLSYMGDRFRSHFMSRSEDGGQTWQASVLLAPGEQGGTKNKPVLLADGTLVYPSNGKGGMRFNFTKDFGQTWLPSTYTPKSDIDVIQPSILLHKDGRLQSLGRSHTGVIVQSWSTDNGQTWSPLEKTSIPNNYSGIDAVTLADGRHLLVYNHTGIPKGRWGGARTPLNIALSDDGINWQAALVLENEPGEFSYPVIIQDKDGIVHVLYTWNRLRMKHATFDPAKLALYPIEDDVWPAAATIAAPTTATGDSSATNIAP